MAVASVAKSKRAPISFGKNRYNKRETSKKKNRSFPFLLPWLATVFTGLLFIVIISVGLLFLYRFFTTSTYFSVKEIQVLGTVRLGYADVLETASLHTGANSLAVNMTEIESRLLRNPWVKGVSVKRELPDMFKIVIQERVPKYWMTHDNKIYYVDERGTPIDYVGPTKFTSLPLLTVEPGMEKVLDRLPELVKELEAARLPVNAGTASWMKLTVSRGVELFFEGSDLTIALSVEGWSQNLDKLGLTLADLGRRGELRRTRHVKVTGDNVWVQVEPEQ